jgi:hypothetical protein
MKERGLRKIKSKRGQELTLGTIILIILGVAVLVFLIWGFSSGWSNLWTKISSYFGGGTNVETVRNACTLACDSKSDYEYCKVGRQLRYNDINQKMIKETKTCNQIAGDVNLKKIIGFEGCAEIPDCVGYVPVFDPNNHTLLNINQLNLGCSGLCDNKTKDKFCNERRVIEFKDTITGEKWSKEESCDSLVKVYKLPVDTKCNAITC